MCHEVVTFNLQLLGLGRVAAFVHIIFVKDYSGILALYASVLRDAGHEVAEATSVVQALRRLLRSGDIDGIVSDVVLPDGTGMQLLNTASRQGIPTMLCTGSHEAMLVLEAQGITHLRKPFDLTAYADSVDGVGQ